MPLPPPIVTDHKTLSSGPHRCRRSKSNREAIEAELFNLRSNRRGFVKSESLRLSPGHEDGNDGKHFFPERSQGRRWQRRRRVDGEMNLIEKMQDAARKAKVLQLRLGGQRSWWPQPGGWRSKVTVLESPTIFPPGGTNESKKERSSTQNTKGVLLVNFPTRRRRQSSFNLDRQFLNKFGKCEISGSKDMSHIQPGQRKPRFGRWKFKNNNMAAPNGEIAACETDDTESTQDDTLQIIEPEERKDQNTEPINNDEKEAEKKKRKNRIKEIVAATSVSGLGIAAAIIFL